MKQGLKGDKFASCSAQRFRPIAAEHLATIVARPEELEVIGFLIGKIYHSIIATFRVTASCVKPGCPHEKILLCLHRRNRFWGCRIQVLSCRSQNSDDDAILTYMKFQKCCSTATQGRTRNLQSYIRMGAGILVIFPLAFAILNYYCRM